MRRGGSSLRLRPSDIAVPHRERAALLRGHLRRFAAGHFFVPVAAEPRVVDRLRACRNDVGYRRVEWHDTARVAKQRRTIARAGAPVSLPRAHSGAGPQSAFAPNKIAR
jgi:hypothetical protein